MDEFVETLWPEVAAMKAAQLNRQRMVLDQYRDSPFVLVKNEREDGTMGVDLITRE